VTFVGKGSSAVGGLFKTAVTFVGGAVAFVDKGGSVIGGRSFKTTGAELYCCWACGGLYGLSCRRSLALAKGEGEASGACAGGACADGACVDGACADEACVGGACIDGACADGACADGVCVGGACWGIGATGG